MDNIYRKFQDSTIINCLQYLLRSDTILKFTVRSPDSLIWLFRDHHCSLSNDTYEFAVLTHKAVHISVIPFSILSTLFINFIFKILIWLKRKLNRHTNMILFQQLIEIFRNKPM